MYLATYHTTYHQLPRRKLCQVQLSLPVPPIFDAFFRNSTDPETRALGSQKCSLEFDRIIFCGVAKRFDYDNVLDSNNDMKEL